ncbi:MAG: site-specific DNA-methyltransferase [Acidimicrobiaceae bacterium]|nr:site-specific DNA-methyltransferase [Acidimicrobiaceae bacterium]
MSKSLVQDAVQTNEEHRVGLYEIGTECTDPSQVSKETQLESLNLNWAEKDLPQKKRTKHVHGLHPYLGKFIPQLVEVFIRKYFSPSQRVFDPFSGSGTTLIQANELGVHSVGCDISAFNVLLTRCKSQKYNIEELRKELTDIIQKTKSILRPDLFTETKRTDSDDSDWAKSEYLRKWYSPQALIDLVVFRDLIPQYKNQDIMKIVLTRAARSARLTTHFDLDFPKKPQTEPYYCYKHGRTCTPVQEAWKFLRRYSIDVMRRVEQFSHHRKEAEVSIIHGDSRSVNPHYIDGVITSPPYVGMIDYHEQHRYAYELLGLEDFSSGEIGPAFKGAGKSAKDEYQALLSEVFRNAAKYMDDGALFVIVAGDRYGLYPKIADSCNLEQIGVVKRHVNRRTGRRSSEFYESIFIWRKIG